MYALVARGPIPGSALALVIPPIHPYPHLQNRKVRNTNVNLAKLSAEYLPQSTFLRSRANERKQSKKIR